MHNFLRLRFDHLVFITLSLAAFLLHYHLGNDFYWHLKTGELLAQNISIPSGDPFSFTFAGAPWVLHEWLFEYALYHLHLNAGIYGVKFASISIVALSIFIVYRAGVALSGDRSLCLALAIVSFILLYPNTLPRPQLFTYLFLAIYLYLLIGFRYRLYPAKLYILPLIMLLWANLHGGYLIGIALIVIFTLMETFERFQKGESKRSALTALRPLFVVTGFCIAASLVNPYTYHHWLYPFQVMSMMASNEIAEWLSPDFHRPLAKIYLFYIFAFLFVLIYNKNKPSLIEAALPLIFIMISFVSRRHTPIALLVLLPFFSLAFLNFKQQFSLSPQLRIAVSRFNSVQSQKEMSNITKYGYLINWLLLSVIVAGSIHLHYIAEHRIALYENDKMPVDAVEFIKNTGINGNVLNTYDYGGYLINSLYPHSKVFIDGRADLYGDDFFFKNKTIMMANRGWRQLINSYPIDYILLKNQAPLNWPLLSMHEFKLIYRDMYNSIYVRNNEKFAALIDKLGSSNIRGSTD